MIERQLKSTTEGMLRLADDEPHALNIAGGWRWVCLVALAAGACGQVEPPGSGTSSHAPVSGNTEPVSSAGAPSPASSAPTLKAAPSAASGEPSGATATPAAETAPAHPGPWLTLLSPSAAVYSAPNPEKAAKLGYVQSGARIPVTGKPKPGDKCASGWLAVVGGGFICSAAGTLDDKEGRTRFTIRRPDLDGVLPYTYARNAKNGTPLYRTIPTASQMLEYEPYLKKETEKQPDKIGKSDNGSAKPVDSATSNGGAAASGTQGSADTKPAKVESATGSSGTNSSAATPSTSEAVPPIQGSPAVPPGNEASEEKPWWQREGSDDKLHELRLSDLKSESDGVLALRMVKGFYIAVDRTFRWHGRTWYKSTKGLVAPADRMGQASPSDFHGVELTAELSLPIGWLYGGREKTQTYELDLDKKRAKPVGTVARFVALPLTETIQELAGITYQKLKDGTWVRKAQLRITEPGSPPAELKEGERWVDVDLSSQTLVLFEGTKPIYATLISSGKSSKIKDKDHSTPTGQWKIREKHVTTTMDGDGTAAGDQPYSIEDVPYVMYFFKSYAIHGAFWHRNYGVQMSHGCVNLAPLDAKAVFIKTAPTLPEQWHGSWSSSDVPGSWVVVHE